MTTIPTTPPEPGSERHKQREALAVAIELTSYDLPLVSDWSVSHWGLEIQLSSGGGTDVDRMAALHTWATFLGDDDGPLHIHTKPYKSDPALMQIFVKTERDGVPVKVWNAVANPDAPAEDAKGGASNE